MEWAYIPAVEVLTRGLVVAAPLSFGTATERCHVLLLLAARAALFIVFASISVKALMLYALAYAIFMTVLRFLDAFQHTYDVYASRSMAEAPPDSARDLRYEQANTYSNLLSARWWWLNLLVLHFPYHNAHHMRPGVPWHRLPTLHRSLYGDTYEQVIPCRELVVSYHRYRVARVLAENYGSVSPTASRADNFLGAVGASFLTAV
jgi:fatty acid desaturase